MKVLSRIAMCGAIFAAAILVAIPAFGQAAGTLDKTFGKSGVTTTTLTTASESNVVVPYSVQVLSNGDLLVLATVVSNASDTTDVLRFTSAGVLDTTFGKKGIAALPTRLGGPNMVLQSNGQIVIAGAATNPSTGASELGVERLNTNGTADTTFGTKGLAMANLPADGIELVVVVEPNGDILTGTQLEPVGRDQPYDTALARFTSNGQLDNTFGSSGTVNIAGVGGCAAIAVLSTGEFMVENGPVIQFTATGTLESSVTGGTIVASGGMANNLISSVFLSSGEYLAAQAVGVGSGRDRPIEIQLQRFTLSGSVDTTFANPIFTFANTTGARVEDAPGGIAVQSNGDIVVIGTHRTQSQSGTAILNGLARFTSSGAFDTTFGTDGVTSNAVPSGTQGLDAVALQSNGDIVTAGIANNYTALTVSRYLGN
jgi:uncharacterized delta-60 repeat protein